MGGGEQRAARFRQLFGHQRQTIKAALELAEVLHAGDDFLPCIAAFLEAYATDRLQIEHLWNKQFAGLRHDLTDTGAYLAEQPGVQIGFTQLRGQMLAHPGGLIRWNPEFAAPRGNPQGDQIVRTDHGVGLGRQLKAQATQGGIAEAEADPAGALVGEPGFGEHRVFFQVRQLRLQQLACHRQQHAVTFEQDTEARLHAAFLRAAGTEASLHVTQVVEVAGQLALEKLGGVGAADGKNAFMGQRAEKSGIGHGSSQRKRDGRHHRGAPGKWVVHNTAGVPDQSRLSARAQGCILALKFEERSMVEDVELNRLYWHSRRGMLELDVLLVPFVREVYSTLNQVDRDCYVRLLECEDQDMFGWFMERAESEDPELQRMVRMILDRVQPK